MTNEEHIEELLLEAEEYGLRNEVFDTARKLMEEGYDRVTSFETAFKKLIII